MSKYAPLASFLKGYRGDACKATFEEIEDVLGFGLPPSARKHRAWWANQFKGNHSQAKAWVDSGWLVDPRQIDLRSETVRFVRSQPANLPSRHAHVSELRQKAMRFSGIDNSDELEEAALKLLISHHAARALVDFGGSDPDAWAPDRRRAE